jgi:ATP phosphoribosyltransferase
MNTLKLVVPKGRIFTAVARLLEDSGIRIAEAPPARVARERSGIEVRS